MTQAIRRDLGEAEVWVLTDGANTFGPELFPGTDAAHLEAMLKASGTGEIRTNFNAVLIRTGGRTILVDTGCGTAFGPAGGRLPQALAEAGARPEDVDILYLTHLHPDHVGGALDAEGRPVFANAELVVAEADRTFFAQPIPGADETLQAWAAMAQQVLAGYGERVRLIAGAAQLAPGLSALPLPGHTPGHAGFRLESGGQMLVHVGDIVHAPAVQLPDPGIAIVFDVDPDTARETRKRLLDELAAEATLCTGGHLLQPAFGRISRAGGGYRWEQAA